MESTDWTEELKRLKTTLKRRLKTARKYCEKMERRLAECQNGPTLLHQAELLQANLYQMHKGDREVTVSDWANENKLIQLTLNPQLKPHEEVAKRFKEAKKLKIGLPHAVQQLKIAREGYAGAEASLLALEAICTKEAFLAFTALSDLPKPQIKIPAERLPAPKPYWEYLSSQKIPIWVGKNASMNEALTFQHAKGNDYWLHVADFPGSHVVIHMPGKNVLDEETLQEACQLALHYSKARLRGEGEVSLTQVKYVRRFGREKGKVQIANEKRYRVRKDVDKLATLRRH